MLRIELPGIVRQPTRRRHLVAGTILDGMETLLTSTRLPAVDKTSMDRRRR
ncbi:hypothetical protein [Jiangella mangrovi]|uniref:Uncharacterized protein n=1 Tax=Jiangella mangrovi TaxID=1524084 RepID=A0A7W9GMI5_9ACTN|nr:hypothetical protein [Jiangella mangrovi]MBB5786413.1 hypothetical protein [Jiangella mangrovi]